MMTGSADLRMIDVAFPISGKFLPREHASALLQALSERQEWLSKDPLVGIHPIKLVDGLSDLAPLSQRTKLTFRIPSARMNDLHNLVGCELRLHNCLLQLGSPQIRQLLPHGTLYAHKVAADSEDEVSFLRTMTAELAKLGVAGTLICGKHLRRLSQGKIQNSFSLMLHGIPPDQSLMLMQYGLGPHRLLGCGIFVPHKSASAVGL